MTRSLVIADASSLIALDNINEIETLTLMYPTFTVTPEVAGEDGLEFQ